MRIHCFKYSKESNYTTSVAVSNNQNVDESDYFCLLLQTNERIETSDFSIFLSDIPFEISLLTINKLDFWYELHATDINGYFSFRDFDAKDYSREFYVTKVGSKVRFSKLFLNYPEGICEISLLNEEKQLQQMNINIHSSKISQEEFISLVEYVANKNISVWSKSSLLRNDTTNAIQNGSFLMMITHFKDFLIELKNKHLMHFCYDKIYSLVPNNFVTLFSEDVSISENSIDWLLENLDTLQPTNIYQQDKILVQNRLFVPEEMLAEELVESTDIYENRLIHGFMSELANYFILKEQHIEEQQHHLNLLNFKNKIEFHNLEKTNSCIKSILPLIHTIKRYLDEHLFVSTETTELLNSYKFESKEHYFFVYRHLLEWLNKKDIVFESEQKVFGGVRRVDNLFELGCLYKIIDSFALQGYSYSILDTDKENIPKIIHFTHLKKNKITLYYEVMPKNLTSVLTSGQLKPDFIIEYQIQKEVKYLSQHHLEQEIEEKEAEKPVYKYVIFDAKYKEYKTIEKYDYPLIALKYLHGIGYENGGLFSPLGLFVLFPNEKEETFSYHNEKFDINSENPIFPAIGSVSIGFKNENKSLEKILDKLGEYV